MEPAEAPAGFPWPVPAGRQMRLPDGTTTWVRQASGPPASPTLLLLHGLTASSSLNWFGCYGPLGEHFGVVAIDLRGHGRGPSPPRRFELDLMAHDAAAVLDHLGLDHVIPVGFSMGGAVAQLLWRHHRDRVAGMVLASSAMRFRMAPGRKRAYGMNPRLARLAQRLPEPARHALVDRLVARMADEPTRRWLVDEMALSDPKGVVRAADALSRFMSDGWAGDVDVPVSVVVATNDRSLSPRSQRALAATIPGSTVVDSPGAHADVVWRPDVTVPGLVRACRELAERL